jgi:glycoside/pentoside/hexuronide:cation symporter, GPH family
LTGERREGQYIGWWSIAKKLSAAVGIGASLSILGMAGYTPNEAQSPEVIKTLRILYALVPSVLNLAGLVIALAYPISDDVHARIKATIERKQSGDAFENPLAAKHGGM